MERAGALLVAEESGGEALQLAIAAEGEDAVLQVVELEASVEKVAILTRLFAVSAGREEGFADVAACRRKT